MTHAFAHADGVSVRDVSNSISTSANPTEAGSTSGSGESFSFNAPCVVAATANAGFTFQNWTEGGAVVSSAINYAFNVTTSRSLVANFATVTFAVSAFPSPPTGGEVSGDGLFASNAVCTVVATPALGYIFQYWSEGGSVVTNAASYAFAVTQPRTLIAKFAPINCFITLYPSPDHAGNVEGGGLVLSNTTCTVIATANYGYTFTDWTEGDTKTTTTTNYTFTATLNRTLVANFTTNNYAITAVGSPIEGGAVVGSGVKPFGTRCTVLATPNTGFAFLYWTEGGSVVTNASPYSFTVLTNRMLTAVFSTNKYAIATNTSPVMAGTTTGGGTYLHGTACTVLTTANYGYTFANWSEGGAVVASTPNYAFAVTRNRTLVANFSTNRYTIATSINPAAGGAATGGGSIAYGTPCTVIAMPSFGYSFVNWSEGGTVVATTSVYAFTVTKSSALVATFAYTATLSEVLDAPSIPWTTNGDASWREQAVVTHDGIDAAQSGSLGDSQSRSLQTEVTGPGTLTFWWKASSEAGYDYLRFSIDGVEQPSSISGETDWRQQSFALSTGRHVLTWTYAKDGSRSSGADCGWVDQVIFTPPRSPVYRFWSNIYRAHFFTMSEAEKDRVSTELPQDWAYEGIAYNAYAVPSSDSTPIYRFWSPRYRGHFYTISEGEKNHIIANFSRDWRYEGPSQYAYASAVAGMMPVYRFWSPRYKHHFFTISEAEKNSTIANLSHDWQYEGVAFHAFPVEVRRGRSATPAALANPSADSDELGVAKTDLVSLTTDEGGVVFPLNFPGDTVTAVVDNGSPEELAYVLEEADSPLKAEVSAFASEHRQRFEVWTRQPGADALSRAHTSWFERQLDPPAVLNDGVESATSESGTGVGLPIERIKMPASDETFTVTFYSATQGVLNTVTGVTGGEMLELKVSEWNCWHWVSVWRDSDGERVMSLWIRHEIEE